MSRIIHFIVFILLFCHYSIACTLWGCVGSSVDGGGLLIAKNRDWDKSSRTSLKLIVPKKGYKYLAMYAIGKEAGVKGGINDKGLVVFSASVSSLKKEDRNTEIKGKLREILSECKSVDEFIKKKKHFLSERAEFLLIGDSKDLISVEVTPDFQIHIEQQKNGFLSHTNHYLNEKFLNYNQIVSKSSNTRYDRICELLKIKTPVSLQDMITYSEDRNSGFDNSIWRDGSFGTDVRTLMNMCVYVPLQGPPIVYAKIADSWRIKKSGMLTLDQEFWKQSGFIELK